MKHKLIKKEMNSNVKISFWKTFKTKTFNTFSTLAKAFMLPIALLPIAGIFLGIGGVMSANSSNATTILVGDVFQAIGGIPFENLAVLFAISIALAYTKDAGVAGLTAFVAWLVFNGFTAAFLQANNEITYDYFIIGTNAEGIEQVIKLNLNDSLSILGEHFKDQASIIAYLESLGYDNLVKGLTDLKLDSVNEIANLQSYNLWFWKGDIAVTPSLVSGILGMNTLNTGVFGGIFVGGVVAYLYNKFHKIELPNVLSFFNGVRFVPIIAFISIIGLSVIFILIWPALGAGLNAFGTATGKLPFGLDSFIYELIYQSLLPFGLHHVFNAPLAYTGAGGSLIEYQGVILLNHAKELANGNQTVLDLLNQLDPKTNINGLLNSINDIFNTNGINPNVYINLETWFNAIKPETWAAQGDNLAQIAVINDGTLKMQDVWNAGLKLGRFSTGGFIQYMFVCPAICVAMVMVIPKENRRKASGIYVSAALTALIFGITEPVEFSFLFAAPWLYYGVYVPLNALIWMSATLSQARVGNTFSCGLIDFIIYGILPFINGNATNFWFIPIIGLPAAGVAFALFFFLLKWKKVEVIGYNGVGVETKLMSKKEYKVAKEGEVKKPDKIIMEIVDAFGGLENVETVDACATRLRVKVKDEKLVSKDKFVQITGAMGVVVKGNSYQVIYGPIADTYKAKIRLLKGAE